MARRCRNFLLALLVTLAATGTSSLAAAQAAENDRAVAGSVTIEPFVFLHPCTGEEVLVTGEVRFVSRQVVDESGQFFTHEIATSGVHFEGVGLTSGAKYIFNGPNPTVRNIVGASEFLLISDFTIVTAGADNNFLGSFTSHLTFNANGELTSVVNEEHFVSCSGG